jgi:hypothetical protein
MLKILLLISFLSFACASHAQKVRVVENSRLAKIVAKIKGEEIYAITIGKTIFVSCKKEDFFANQWWVKHELAHVRQYEKHGTVRFLALYIYYSVFHHKSVNPFELEAEIAEHSGESSFAHTTFK